MFCIVLLSPASTIVILAGGLDIVFGIPYALVSSALGAIMLIYAVVCSMGDFKVQTKVTFALTITLGLTMLLVVIGGAVYAVHDISDGRIAQKYYFLHQCESEYIIYNSHDSYFKIVFQI